MDRLDHSPSHDVHADDTSSLDGCPSRLIVLTSGVNRATDVAAVMLAAGIDAALRSQDGVWFDDGVKAGERAERPWCRFPVERLDDLVAATDLPLHQAYVAHALWPVLHGRSDLIVHRARETAAHRRVLAAIAQRLAAAGVREEDSIWVHDFALLGIGDELRRLGVRARIGFSLHAPMPSSDVLTALPGHREWLGGLLAYDLVSLPTDRDVASLVEYVETELNATAQDDTIVHGTHRCRLAALPLTIHPAMIEASVRDAAPARGDLRGALENARDKQLMIAADRLDAVSGVAERFRSIDRLLMKSPELRGTATLMQIASPPGYGTEDQLLLRRLQRLVGSINGRHGEPDWAPIQWMHRRYDVTTLAALFRNARVGLMTPLREGCSVTAQAYLAAQDPADPGVLVLSRFAGAIEAVADEALLVNPRDTDELANAYQQALAMPLEERRARHGRALAALHDYDVIAWREQFLGLLAEMRVAPRRERRVESFSARSPIARIAQAALATSR